MLGITGDIADKDDDPSDHFAGSWTRGGLDVLINNASSLGPVPLAPLADAECEELERRSRRTSSGRPPDEGGIARWPRRRAKDAVRIGVNVSSDAAVNAYPDWAPTARARPRCAT